MQYSSLMLAFATVGPHPVDKKGAVVCISEEKADCIQQVGVDPTLKCTYHHLSMIKKRQCEGVGVWISSFSTF